MMQQLLYDPLSQFYQSVVAALPNLVGMLVFIILGLALGWLIKVALSRVLRLMGFDYFCRQTGMLAMLQKAAISARPSDVAASLAGWITVLLGLVLGLNALNFPATNELVTSFFIFLPHLLVSLLLLTLGYLLSRFVERGVLIAAVNAGLRSARLLSRGVFLLLMIFVASLSLEHLGVARSTIVAAFSILFGGVVLALAIAFGLGGRHLARKLLDSRMQEEEPEKVARASFNSRVRHL